jgi:two-component system sensor histidine kinase/response regulator
MEIHREAPRVSAANATGRPDGPAPTDDPRVVLVAEDNEVNRLVARGVLEGLGYSVAFAVNGLEAVAAVSAGSGRFAAVLMDCRMPRLDGYEATKVIRKLEPPGTRVPVIALTGSDPEGARARCLAAGMDDFLLKPVDFALLEVVLARWVDGVTPVSQPAESLDTSGVLDLARVRMLRDLVTGEGSFFEACRDSFLTRVPVDLESIASAVRDGDHVRLSAAAHALKGSAQNLGAAEVGRLCQLLEAAAERLDLVAATALVATLEQQVELTSIALSAA